MTSQCSPVGGKREAHKWKMSTSKCRVWRWWNSLLQQTSKHQRTTHITLVMLHIYVRTM